MTPQLTPSLSDSLTDLEILGCEISIDGRQGDERVLVRHPRLRNTITIDNTLRHPARILAAVARRLTKGA